MIRSTLLATGCVVALAFAALPTLASDESTVVPPTPHQDEVLRGAQQTDTPSGAVGDIECGMPASPHQMQTMSQNPPAESEKMQPQSGMPASPHQQQVLKSNKITQPGESC
jgi:hypothetical protein